MHRQKVLKKPKSKPSDKIHPAGILYDGSRGPVMASPLRVLAVSGRQLEDVAGTFSSLILNYRSRSLLDSSGLPRAID